MSGFAGIFHHDARPAERARLEKLAAALAFRGPDGNGVWMGGSAGMVHTLFRTTREAENEKQPCTLDAQVWITADARLDARDELIRELRGEGEEVAATANEPELLLHAYRAWGKDCLAHLLGDFSFGIWDSRKQAFFCARDHFGIRPFYYAHIGSLFAFSNTLECLRIFPEVSERLDDLAIADFLLFQFYQNPEATAFADVRRLPAAHLLTADRGGIEVRRYWELPVEGPTRYKRMEECVEAFTERFDQAIADRLRTDRAGISMSGGLDSTSVAAAVMRVSKMRGRRVQLCAFTISNQGLIDDPEEEFARAAASGLQIPQEMTYGREFGLYDGRGNPQVHMPEPFHDPFLAMERTLAAAAAQHSRVMLSGLGGDNLFHSQSWPYLTYSIRRGRVDHVAREFGGYLLTRGKIPPPLVGIRARVRRIFRLSAPEPGFPGWLNEDLVNRLGLRERFRQFDAKNRCAHPFRPTAYQSTIGPIWPLWFDFDDAGFTGIALEHRHPFFDLRVVRMALALPPVPYCVDKELLRVAGKGVLPETIRTREKTPLQGSLLEKPLSGTQSSWVDDFRAAPELERYVVRSKIPRMSGVRASASAWENLKPLSLNVWLESFRRESLPSHRKAAALTR